MEQNISVYRSLKEIKAITFHEIKFEGNIKLVDKNFTEGKEYDAEDIVKLNDAWLSLYDEYFERTLDTKYTKTLSNNKKCLDLLFTISIMETIIKQMEFIEQHCEYLPENTYVETLINLKNNLKRLDPKIKFKDSLEIKEALQPVKDYLGGLQTRYKLLFKEDLKVDKVDIQLFYDIKTAMEGVLGRDLLEIVNMLQWISYEKEYKRKLKNGSKQHSRTKGSRRNSKNVG